MPPKSKSTTGAKKPAACTRTKLSTKVNLKEVVDASSSPEPEETPKKTNKIVIKAVRKAKKNSKGVARDSSGEEESDGGGEPEDGPKVDWKDENLNFLLIAAIEEDEEIKQGLFPLPGANASLAKGGSKPKTEYQWELAKQIFEYHEKYKDVFAQAKTPAEKGVWGRKIKNRLKRMTQEVRKYRDEMGETGAGITHEKEINMELNNSFTNKWAVIKMKCPWYWQLKAIISERPNQVPAGIGNNTSNYDVSLLLASSAHTSELDISGDGIVGVDDDDADDTGSKDIGNESDGGWDEGWEEETQIVTKDSKRKAAVLEEAKPVITPKKTAAQNGKSAPATTAQSRLKKLKTGAKRMNVVAIKEEETTQRVMELRKEKVRLATEKQVAKVRARADVKMQADRLKAELATKQMEMEYQLRMAQFGCTNQNGLGGQSPFFAGNMGPTASPSSANGGWTGAGSTTPSSYLGAELPLESSTNFNAGGTYNFDFSYDLSNDAT